MTGRPQTAKDVSRAIFATLDGVKSDIAIEGMATALSVTFVQIYRDIAVEGFDVLVEDMRNNIEEHVRKARG